MNRLTILCESCEREWSVACALSVYEKQSLESRPCPHCGAYTLCCLDLTLAGAVAERPVTWHSSTF